MARPRRAENPELARARKRKHDQLRAAHANVRRCELLIILAPDGRCAICKKKPRDIGKLHVDHVDGRSWALEDLGRWSRVERYWEEFLAGVALRALCITCNNQHRPPKTASVPHHTTRRRMRALYIPERPAPVEEPVPF